MKNRQTAMGIDTTGAPLTEIAIPSKARVTLGATLPMITPAVMQSITHAVRYFSKKQRPLDCPVMWGSRFMKCTSVRVDRRTAG